MGQAQPRSSICGETLKVEREACEVYSIDTKGRNFNDIKGYPKHMLTVHLYVSTLHNNEAGHC